LLVRSFVIDPMPLGFFPQDHGHAVMHQANQGVRSRGDDEADRVCGEDVLTRLAPQVYVKVLSKFRFLDAAQQQRLAHRRQFFSAWEVL
jgi:hypothetical protein